MVDGFRLPQQFAHTVGIDEAQFLIEQAADEVAIAVQHIILGLGRRIREAVFLRVQFLCTLFRKSIDVMALLLKLTLSVMTDGFNFIGSYGHCSFTS